MNVQTWDCSGLGEWDMARWVVKVGDGEIVIETRDDLVVIDIPSKQPLTASRRQVEDLRLKLGAAIPDRGAQR